MSGRGPIARRALRTALAAVVPCALIGAQAPVSVARVASAPRKSAKTPANKLVAVCLHHARLTHVSDSAGQLWVGWDPQVGGFVYVQKYRSPSSAMAEAKFLKDEESGVAGRLAISQHVAPYKGSPVPVVVKCLGGQMISKKPTKTSGSYTF